MEIYSLIPLLMALFFPLIASGCAELPNSKTKRCPLFYYGVVSLPHILAGVWFINLLFYYEEQPPQMCYLLPKWEFWTFYCLIVLLNCCGLWEIHKKQAILSKKEKLMSISFICLGLFMLFAFLIFSIFIWF